MGVMRERHNQRVICPILKEVSTGWIALWRYLFLSTDSRDTLGDQVRLDLAIK